MNVILKLNVNRVDLVGEGANTAAFIKLAKGREKNQMSLEQILASLSPEQSTVIKSHIADLDTKLAKACGDQKAAEDAMAEEKKAKETAEADCKKAKEDLAVANETIVKSKIGTGGTEDENMESVIKSLSPEMQVLMKGVLAKQKAAETIAADLIEKSKTAEAMVTVAKMKAIPVEEKVLLSVVKSATDDTKTVLLAAAEAIEKGLLNPVGKSAPGKSFEGKDAWSQIEKSAKEIATAEKISMDAAIAKSIVANPELYTKYLEEVRNDG